MKAIFITLNLFIFASDLAAQSSFLPKNLGAAVNSKYDDINPVVSPDGKFLFFVRVNHPENTFGATDSEDIWHCERLTDSTWTVAKRAANLNIGRYNAVLSFLSDGRSILLNGVFNKKGNEWKKRGLSISVRDGNEWSKPQRLRVAALSKKNRGLRSSGSMASNGKVLVLSYSRTFNGTRNDLFVSEKKSDGTWSRPSKLKSVSSAAHDDSPFLSDDLKTIYFASNRDGDFSIYEATRTSADWQTWSRPKLLSDTINSNQWDGYYKTTQKGSWAYFSSEKKSTGGADIFKVKRFENNPFVIVAGTLFNNRNMPLTGKDIMILVNGKAADSVRLNKDSARYRVKLPLGKSYTISARLPYHTSSPVTVDVTSQKEFSKTQRDLTLTPFPFVNVIGKVIVQNTGMPISVALQPRVTISGVSPDSITYDANRASYSARIRHGATYELRAMAMKHETLPKKLDLSAIAEYQELVEDLYLLEEKMATLTGKILDKKTGKPLTRWGEAKINVEGMSSVAAKIDTVSGNYEITLPLGANYTVSANAPNYYPLYEAVSVAFEKTELRIVKDLVIVPIEVGQSIRLNNIFFDPGKAVLKSESFPELDRVAEFLSNSPAIKVEIGGHTDNVGNAGSNQKLSQSRAQAVADYVIAKGIAKERVVAKGYGLSKPIVSNATKEGKAQNRRVEFTVLDN